MVTHKLSIEELEFLKRIPTPTISNAIETFNLRPRNEGYTSPPVRCLFPDLGVMVGYAATARIKADQPPAGGQPASRFDYWDYLLKMPEPRIAVVQDLDQPRASGAFWGEVNASVHRALHCVGTITDGGVRDLDEVHALGFHFFAAEVIVSHAYVHLIDFGGPVKIGNLVVNPGDLIHADKHGAIVVPHEIAREVAVAAAMIEATERQIINYCRSSNFSVEQLKVLVRKLTDTK